jgi:hypothetical protein
LLPEGGKHMTATTPYVDEVDGQWKILSKVFYLHP